MLVLGQSMGMEKGIAMEVQTNAAKRKRGRPKREHAPDPAAILAAALGRFARNGFHGTNLRDIAADAEVDVALVARQFGSKMGLWKAVVDEIAVRMADAQADIAALQDDPMPLGERIGRALDRFVAFNAAHRELGQFFVNEVTRAGERRDYVLERLWLPNRRALLPLLKDGIDAGIVAASDPELALLMLVGAVALPLITGEMVSEDLGRDMETRLSQGVKALLVRA